MTRNAVDNVPWQVTGNHWLSLPCVHPADGALHAIGLLHRGARAALEFAGAPDFLSGTGTPLARPTLHVNGQLVRADHVVIATHVPLQGKAGTAAATLLQTRLAAYSTYAVSARWSSHAR